MTLEGIRRDVGGGQAIRRRWWALLPSLPILFAHYLPPLSHYTSPPACHVVRRRAASNITGA